MKQIRQLHLYLGTFFAPAIIFYAVTGAFQTFQYHEEHEGRPPIPLFEKMAEIHKDQRVPKWSKPAATATQGDKPAAAPPATEPVTSPEAHTAAPDAQSQAAGKAAPQQRATNGPPRTPRRKPSVPFKVFAVLMSGALVLTTFLGIYMSFKYNRDQRIVWGLLTLGAIIPIVLLFL